MFQKSTSKSWICKPTFKVSGTTDFKRRFTYPTPCGALLMSHILKITTLAYKLHSVTPPFLWGEVVATSKNRNTLKGGGIDFKGGMNDLWVYSLTF